MLTSLKKRLYFIVAAYFLFWAKFVLRRWQPRIIVITGSSGKTTALHLLEAQLGADATYSHHANGAFGIAFQLLGLPTNITARSQWPVYALKAPFKILHTMPKTKFYVVEADCDRPHEGQMIAKFLQPEAVLWISVYRTHSANFDKLVRSGAFPDHISAIGYEFGHFAAQAQKLVIANDQPEIKLQLDRVQPPVTVQLVGLQSLTHYKLEKDHTSFTAGTQHWQVPGLHAKNIGVSVQMIAQLMDYLGKPLDDHFSKLVMPPGRLSIFAGKKGTVLLDSTYNSAVEATQSVLQLFQDYPKKVKVLVLGDMVEQGSLEQSEHERLAEIIAKVDLERVVFLGPRTEQYTAPKLKKLKPKLLIDTYLKPTEVLADLQQTLTGNEAVLFKGSRYLEGVIEQLLADPKDAQKLVRREARYRKIRQNWGLPA